MRKKYSIEIDVQDFGEVFGWEDRYRFLNYDTLVAEGNFLDELLDNAIIFTTTDDGDSGPEISIGELPTDLYHIAEAMIAENFTNLGSL